MNLPKLPAQERAQTQQLAAFGGLRLDAEATQGELADCRNLSTRAFPHIAPRRRRMPMGDYTAPTALFAWDKMILVDATRLLCDGKEVGTLSPGEKQFAVVNTRLCIWPDKKYLDLKSQEFGDLAPRATMVAGTSAIFTDNSLTMDSSFAAVTSDFLHAVQQGVHSSGFLTTAYSAVAWTAAGGWVLSGGREVSVDNYGTGRPPQIDTALVVGDLVMLRHSDIQGSFQLNTRSYDYDLKRKSVTYGSYSEHHKGGYYGEITALSYSLESEPGLVFLTMHVTFRVRNAQFEGSDLTTLFSPGDRVRLSGCTTLSANNTAEKKHLVVQTVQKRSVSFREGGLQAGTETGAVVLERPLPPIDYICQWDNRLFGVSNEERVIYGSALGDPKNFFVYEGLSTDSYAVAVASQGAFTGLCAYSGSLLCFKEDRLYKLMGSYPAEYQLYPYSVAGLQAGSHKSLCVLGERLYYKGRDGVYLYSGGVPQRISDALGDMELGAAVAGGDGRRYYLSALDKDKKATLLVYDSRTGLWLREDESRAVDFCLHQGKLYFLCGGSIWAVDADMGSEEVAWMAQLAPFRQTQQRRSSPRRLFLRVRLEAGSWVLAECAEDGAAWRQLCRIHGGRERVVELPLPLRPCFTFGLRLQGSGGCEVLALRWETVTGG